MITLFFHSLALSLSVYKKKSADGDDVSPQTTEAIPSNATDEPERKQKNKNSGIVPELSVGAALDVLNKQQGADAAATAVTTAAGTIASSTSDISPLPFGSRAACLLGLISCGGCWRVVCLDGTMRNGAERLFPLSAEVLGEVEGPGQGPFDSQEL